ncbi:MAG: DMT family transporter [Candidatus Nanohaloarchaea archaeon]|nr:DMT family transporter [Candidatus Nanohaloarchaea archaeon]
MTLSPGVLLGIVAMLGYGLADFFVERATRDADVFDTVLWSKAVSAGLIGAVVVARRPSLSMGRDSALLIAAAGLLAVAAYLAFYHGIQVGKLSIVSPVASGWGAVSAIVGVAVLGQVLSGVQAAAVATVVAGTVLASFRRHDLAGLQWRNYEVGIEYGAVSLLAWGVSFAIVDVAVGRVGWLPSIAGLLTVVLAAMLGYGLVSDRSLSPPDALRSILLIGVFEAVAYVALGVGLVDFDAALVAPVAAAFPVVTVVLARLFLDEPLDGNQWLGIAGIVAGVVLLSV